MYSETIRNKVSVWFEMKEGLLACQGNDVKLNGATGAIYYHCGQTVVVWKSYEPYLYCTNNNMYWKEKQQQLHCHAKPACGKM